MNKERKESTTVPCGIQQLNKRIMRVFEGEKKQNEEKKIFEK